MGGIMIHYMNKLNHVVGIYFAVISIAGLFVNLQSVQAYLLQFSALELFLIFQYVFFFESPVLAALLLFSTFIFYIKNKQIDFRSLRSAEKTFFVSFLILFFSSLGWLVCVLLFRQYAGMLIIPMILNAFLIVVTTLFGLLTMFRFSVNMRAVFWTLFIFIVAAILFFFAVIL